MWLMLFIFLIFIGKWTTLFADKFREQVEERLDFEDTSVDPCKNIDVIKAVMEHDSHQG